MKNIMLVEAEIWTVARTDKGNAVLVKPVGSDRAVPIFIGQLEAQSILFGLASVPVPRPMTHDLFISVLEKSNMSVERVEITDLKDRTFYSRLVIKQGLKRIVVDSRPSDSLGIASRVQCPVYIAESIVDEAGVAVNLITDEDAQLEPMDNPEDPDTAPEETAPPTERTRLEAALEKAVQDENYEEAARIRDRMQEL
ncbi:MAG: bifunctional nuclease family protein [Spirochaeta sp.]|jgi:bifunctional DNase/RNase|nr:bifunctional nuclease family protein [Spirochaeta sp.]